jgi:hypothetical protein
VVAAVINSVSLDHTECVDRQKLRGQNAALSDIFLFSSWCSTVSQKQGVFKCSEMLISQFKQACYTELQFLTIAAGAQSSILSFKSNISRLPVIPTVVKLDLDHSGPSH